MRTPARPPPTAIATRRFTYPSLYYTYHPTAPPRHAAALLPLLLTRHQPPSAAEAPPVTAKAYKAAAPPKAISRSQYAARLRARPPQQRLRDELIPGWRTQIYSHTHWCIRTTPTCHAGLRHEAQFGVGFPLGCVGLGVAGYGQLRPDLGNEQMPCSAASGCWWGQVDLQSTRKCEH